MAERTKTVNGKTRSIIFTQEQDDRLEKLLEKVGEYGVANRNQFFRLVAEKMVPSDVRSLVERK
jgi:hypothetical protein